MTECMGKIRHIFLGGNTGSGFYSFYKEVCTGGSTRVFILKGGPGTGKSTFMKSIAGEMRRRGFDVELAHCSSDHNSLDGLFIPVLGIAMLDGTAPHIVEPRYPGAVDEILNFGVFWDEKGIRSKKRVILELTQAIDTCFSRAYGYLGAAAAVHREWSRVNRSPLQNTRLTGVIQELQRDIIDGQKPGPGNSNVRRLFAGAVTPAGPVHYLESIYQEAENLYVLEGPPGSGREIIIEKLVRAAEEKNLTMEVFYCGLHPEKPEHLWFPGTRTGIITSTPPHQYPAHQAARLVTLEALPWEGSFPPGEIIEESRPVFNSLLDKAVTWLQRAKKAHDELENCYSPYMNFSGLEKLGEKILAGILKYAAEKGAAPV